MVTTSDHSTTGMTVAAAHRYLHESGTLQDQVCREQGELGLAFKPYSLIGGNDAICNPPTGLSGIAARGVIALPLNLG